MHGQLSDCFADGLRGMNGMTLGWVTEAGTAECRPVLVLGQRCRKESWFRMAEMRDLCLRLKGPAHAQWFARVGSSTKGNVQVEMIGAEDVAQGQVAKDNRCW